MACELRHAGMLLLLLRALPGHLPAMCFVMCGADRVESSGGRMGGRAWLSMSNFRMERSILKRFRGGNRFDRHQVLKDKNCNRATGLVAGPRTKAPKRAGTWDLGFQNGRSPGPGSSQIEV